MYQYIKFKTTRSSQITIHKKTKRQSRCLIGLIPQSKQNMKSNRIASIKPGLAHITTQIMSILMISKQSQIFQKLQAFKQIMDSKDFNRNSKIEQLNKKDQEAKTPTRWIEFYLISLLISQALTSRLIQTERILNVKMSTIMNPQKDIAHKRTITKLHITNLQCRLQWRISKT